MQLQRGLAIIVSLLLLIVTPVFPTLAQTSTPTPTPIPRDVAILVVDVFEEPFEVEPISLETLSAASDDDPEPQCAISLDGQDGAAIRGTSVTSNMRPYARPHGRLVFKHFENILNSSGIAGIPTPSQYTTEESWNTPRGTIWLKAVDTKKYNIKAIAEGVRLAVEDLAQKGITHVIINMSFAVVPCNQIPEVNIDDYKNQLSAWGITCPDRNAKAGTYKGFSELACSLERSNVNDFAQGLINTRDSKLTENAVAYATLQLAVMQPKIAAIIPAPPDGPGTPFTAFTNLLPPDVSVIQVASAGNDIAPYPYFPALSANVLSVAANYDNSTCPLPKASQQAVETYLKRVGVTTNADVIANKILNPTSNGGEVKADGNTSLTPSDYFDPPPPNPSDTDVLGCLFGTSFAAPQASVLMAIDQQVRNSVECKAPTSDVFSPPLAYQKWDSLDILTQAPAQYCTDFPQ